MKKVLVFRSQLLPPSETFIRDQVSAYSSWKPVLVGFERAPDGLTVDDLNLRLIDSPGARWVGKVRRAVCADLGATRGRFVDACRQERSDLLHVHFGTDAVTFWPAARRLSVPVVVTLHGHDINIYREAWERNRLRMSKRFYPRRLLKMAAAKQVHFVAVSEDIRKRAIEYGIAAERITVCHIGIDLSRFELSGPRVVDRPKRILFVGRLVEKKGAEYLIRAFERVAAQVPGAQLAIAGAGPCRPALELLAGRLGVRVDFMGSLTRADVIRQLSLARVFCLPGITAGNGDAEGFGMVVLEAQACGLPVVTSARGARSEGIVDRVTGFAVPERDIGALADRLTALLVNDALASSMSQAAIPHVRQKFEIKSCTAKLEQLYDRLTA